VVGFGAAYGVGRSFAVSWCKWRYCCRFRFREGVLGFGFLRGGYIFHPCFCFIVDGILLERTACAF
jgi:hypothetical protein